MAKGNRYLIILAIFCMVLSVGACAKKAVEPATQEVTPPPAAAPAAPQQPQVAPPPEPMPEVTTITPMSEEMKAFEANDIFFNYDAFDLSADARKILADKAAFLNAHPNMKIRIEGNCDERGTTEYNLALGDRRAKAAMDYLAFLGIKADRISTVSYGEDKPLDPSHTEEAWAKNRRDHFVILK
jgi:peptidoglycan-associated lipoprotein